jgi:hypothetical protein
LFIGSSSRVTKLIDGLYRFSPKKLLITFVKLVEICRTGLASGGSVGSRAANAFL